jgi:hypothetical protein
MRVRFLIVALAGVLTANHAFAGPIITLGTYILAPNRAGQTITLVVSGGSQVTGFNLRAQSGDGLGPNPEPIFQAVGFNGGIWDAFPTTVVGGPVSGAPQYAQASVVFSATGESVAASGNLVTLTLDTIGLYSGTYSLALANTDIGADSVFIGSGDSDLPATITNGLVKISLPGDANLDGKVDVNDLTIVLTDFGQTGMTWSEGDFNGDGKVDVNDLTIVLSNFGQTSSASIKAVPEPATIAMLAGGLIGLLAYAWRRRGHWA